MTSATGRRCRAIGLALAAFLFAGGASAQVDPVLQPRGTPIPGLPGVPSITTGADANLITSMPGPPTQPWDNTQPAGVVRTTQTEYYVRLYSPPNSQPNRAWIMRAATVRGLTAEELRDRFALPFLPTFVTNVVVPAGTCLVTGIAGPITGSFPGPPPGPWGQGGAQQTWIAGYDSSTDCSTTSYLSPDAYTNQRALGVQALWYAPVVSGNAAAAGGYLDRLPAPVEYSDLFGVYNTLDLLNDGTATRLRPALREIAGEGHAAAGAIAADAGERFVRGLAAHARDALAAPVGRPPAALGYAAAPGTPPAAPLAHWFLIGNGDFGRTGGNDERAGYRFTTGTFGVGYDHRPSADRLSGLALAYQRTGFEVDGAGDSGTVDGVHGAVYGAAALGDYRFAGAASAGYERFGVTRLLPTFARAASSRYDGWTIAASGEAARPFAVAGATVEPLVGLSIVHAWRAGFDESGAGALSLEVAHADVTKIASRIGVNLARPAALAGGGMLVPWLTAAWAHDFADSVNGFSAALTGATAPGAFVVKSADGGRDAALLGAGATFDLADGASFVLAYRGTLRRDAEVHAVSATGRWRW